MKIPVAVESKNEEREAAELAALAAPVEWLAAEAAYNGFTSEMTSWMPTVPEWNSLSPRIRRAWLAAARAAWPA